MNANVSGILDRPIKPGDDTEWPLDGWTAPAHGIEVDAAGSREGLCETRKWNDYSTMITSTATLSFCFGDPTMMPSIGETSEKSRPTPRMM
jgi:hypothetical protein